MNVMILEDDEHKAAQIEEFVRSRWATASIMFARSYNSGLRQIVKCSPEVIILDMSLPTFDASSGEAARARPLAGRDILYEIDRREINSRVVVVTQFETFGEGEDLCTLDELKKELEGEFGSQYLGTVYYHPAQSTWREELAKALGKIRW